MLLVGNRSNVCLEHLKVKAVISDRIGIRGLRHTAAYRAATYILHPRMAAGQVAAWVTYREV